MLVFSQDGSYENKENLRQNAFVCVVNSYIYFTRPIYIEQWSVNTNGQAAGNLLTELSAQGMNIRELASYLKQINVDTYNLGLAPYGKYGLRFIDSL